MNPYTDDKLNNQQELIKRWFKKSEKQDGGVFDQFIALWISFNAFYACPNKILSERNQLKIFQDTYKKMFLETVNDENYKNAFFNLKSYIENKEINKGYIQDLRHDIQEEQHKKRYSNVGSLCEFLECIYQVRCNLFHGGKQLEDGQDKDLVKHAYTALKCFLTIVYTNKNLI